MIVGAASERCLRMLGVRRLAGPEAPSPGVPGLVGVCERFSVRGRRSAVAAGKFLTPLGGLPAEPTDTAVGADALDPGVAGAHGVFRRLRGGRESSGRGAGSRSAYSDNLLASLGRSSTAAKDRRSASTQHGFCFCAQIRSDERLVRHRVPCSRTLSKQDSAAGWP